MLPKPIALFDMDGTLFDYEGRLREKLERMRSPVEGPIPEKLWDEDKYPWLKERMHVIKNEPGFWRELPKLTLGWDVYNMAKHVGYCIHILTKGPSSRPHAWAEKVECIHKHICCKDVTIHLTEDKSIQYGRVLVDDYPPYVESWLEFRPRGLVIMPAHKYNEGFKHNNVIRYNGENDEEVLEALAAAAQRSPNEHWRDIIDQPELSM